MFGYIKNLPVVENCLWYKQLELEVWIFFFWALFCGTWLTAIVFVKLVRWSVHLEVLLLCNLCLPDIGGMYYAQIPGRLELKYLMFSLHSCSNVFMQSLLWKKKYSLQNIPAHDPEEFWDWKIVFMFTIFLCGHFCLVLCSLLAKVTVVLLSYWK